MSKDQLGKDTDIDKESEALDSSESLKTLVKKRGVVKTKLTLFIKFIEELSQIKGVSEVQKTELRERLAKISSVLDRYTEIQDEIELNTLQPQAEIIERETFENKYYAVVAKCKSFLSRTSSGPGTSSTISKGNIKLPTISLPSFDGSYDQFIEFRDTYLSLIHNSQDIDNIQKFHYLRSALTGNALQVIKSLEFSSDNYITAWDLLMNRYNNNRLLVHNHVKALFNTQSVNKESAPQIRKLIDSILRNLRALKTLGEPTSSWDTLIIYIVASKLDPSTEREWEIYKGTLSNSLSNNKLCLNDLIKFLKDRADVLETINVSHNKHTHTQESTFIKKPIQNTPIKSHSYAATKGNNNHNIKSHPRDNSKPFKPCNLCNASHPIYSCEQFLNFSGNEKLKYIAENNICRNCLRYGHAVSNCWFGPCKKCNMKHNTLIHSECQGIDAAGASKSSAVMHTMSTMTSQEPVNPQSHTSSFCHAAAYTHNDNLTHSFIEPVLLSTALVEVADKNNKYHTTRVLLDNGSQHCFISESLCKTLQIPLIQSTVTVTGVGNSLTKSTQSCQIKMQSKTSSYHTQLDCLVLTHITSQLPTLGSKHTLNIPSNIRLADPQFNNALKIDILIGANKFWELLNTGLIRTEKGPYLQNTKLGWVISGPCYLLPTSRLQNIQCNYTQSNTLDFQLKSFWELEEISSNKINKYSKSEMACENLFMSSTTRNNEGRFTVRIPFKESPSVLGDTHTLAQNRFFALERRLEKGSPEYKKMYSDFMTEYLHLGHMSRIYDYKPPYYFMPHHGVFREHSTTTRLRVVFDASAKSSSGKSLNDIQEIGPPLQNSIISILLRFRQYKYIACADVAKMYRQILVDHDQRNLQLILWRSNPSDPLGVYQLNTVTYGTASAPYLSIRCLKQLANECTDDVIAQIINEDFFVDDLLVGHEDKDRLLDICDKVSTVLDKGCFPLRKWVFNYDYSHSKFASKELSLGDKVQTKTLGLGWLISTDHLIFTSKCNVSVACLTKRTILSNISQIYDPLGLLAPVIITIKILLQKLWLCKISWDDPVPQHIAVTWQNFTNNLSQLENLKIKRHVKGDNTNYIELHIFSDASQDAYGACAYVRSYIHSRTDDSLPSVHLLCAKSKVAPLKPISIPRLELCGALVGAQLYDKIISSLRLKFDRVYFWSDSTIVIGWLRMTPSSLKPFVQNRVVEINELTNDSIWLHVAGKQNPADLLSRGTSIETLISSKLWWEGPAYLHKIDAFDNFACTISNEELPELRKTHTLTLTCQTELPYFPFDRFSSFSRMQRTFAYVLRFIHNSRHKDLGRKAGSLSIDELNYSTLRLAVLSQKESLHDVYDMLLEGNYKRLPRNISGLNAFIDKTHNLIRVGGRLSNADFIDFEKKHPILLCAKHNFTKLLFRSEHTRLLHAGPQLMLATLREFWWPLRGRNLARQTVLKCVKCTRLTGKTLQIQMGNLPIERLEPGYPFIRCGVDYAGPLFILNRKGRGAKLEKCYICLFVCFITRAIHLELVTSLSTEAYLLALKRFISRRGKPSEIFSDNGKTFVGALKELTNFLNTNSNFIIDAMSNEQIKLSFIPPYSPHFGGLWEAGVKSCKFHLRRVVGNANLTYEELSTVLAQIEAVLNSRPLTPMSADPNDLLPLCPSHFLVGRPLTAPAGDDLTTKKAALLPRYGRIEQMRQHFWQRWSKEYISELQTRTKWQSNKDTILPNTLILIKEDNAPPLQWRLGRVIKTFEGKDGKARVALIKTASGEVQRSFAKICPLPSCSHTTT